MIFVNFKTYEQGSGEHALKLITILEAASEAFSIAVIPVVQAGDVKEARANSKLEIWTQHIDPVEFGAHTGFILPEAVFEDGAKGTFLNHSEHKFAEFSSLEAAERRAKEVGLKTLIFAGGIDELEKVSVLSPDFLAYEPPELVGSTSTSVSSAHPDIIAKAYEIAKRHDLPLIVGAGVHSRKDVEKSIELGAVGVAVATDIVKAQNPKAELEDLLAGFKK